MEHPTFRQRLQTFLESDTLTARLWALFINALIVASIVQIAGEYGFLNLRLTPAQNVIADLTIASIFAVEYLTRLYAAPARLKFVINIFSVIDLFAIIPSFIGFGQAKALRALRILRALRVLRFLRIMRLIKALDIADVYQREAEAHEEVEYYSQLLATYRTLSSREAADARAHLEPLAAKTAAVLTATGRNIETNAQRGTASEKQVFYLSFYELVSQVRAVLKDLLREESKLALLMYRYLLRELGILLQAEHTVGPVEQLNDVQPGRDFQFLQLVRVSIRDILMTFSVAVGLNVVIRLTPLQSSLEPFLQHLSFIEGAMAALIVFITSFNMSYTNSKRGDTDLAIIDFTNLLAIYAERLRSLLVKTERSEASRRTLQERLDHYFGNIGLDIINGVRQGNRYHLRFDTAAAQGFDRIRGITAPYLEKLDDISRVRIEQIHDDLASMLNKFQTISTIRTAIIFNALNHWIIRITYFLLAVLSPLSALPRLFFVNLMQRAFYKTANETDNAIFSISLSKLPIEDRVLRRLCRISAVLQP